MVQYLRSIIKTIKKAEELQLMPGLLIIFVVHILQTQAVLILYL